MVHVRDSKALVMFLQVAVSAMFGAKDSGRNRICCFDSVAEGVSNK